jgi:murein DD-endopeptidase MepM/ murein hydrolase activator NlpD
MTMKNKFLLRAVSLLLLLALLFPVNNAGALAAPALPPVDMFQLPWDQGLAWVAIDGFDNGSKRPVSSSHNHKLGGAIDFAPKSTMITGENTSNFWVTAAAAGIVVETSNCHISIAHENGWLTQYQFLGNIQVQLGDSVSRNQRVGIIADGIRYKYCAGYVEPNVPHLHFMLRPTMIGATFAGWQFNYNPLFNRTTFTKGLITVGLFKPLLNVPIVPPTATPTMTTTATPVSETPTATPSPTRENSPTPTLFGPYVSTTVDPLSILIGDTAQATIRLNNVPAEGYTSAEFTCSFTASIVEVSNITVTDLFGADAAVAINGPQSNTFIIAIAGSNGNKATTSGTVFTFDVKGLQVGETNLGCEARVSTGDNVLTQIPSAVTFLTVLSTTDTPTPNLTPSTPTVQPSTCDRAEFIADVNVPPGTVMSPGTTFTKTWRLKNLGPCTWTTAYSLVFFYGELMGATTSASFTQSVDVGETVDISINMTAPNAPGSYRGFWMFRNASGINFGIGPDANQPWFVDINVSGPTLPPSLTPTLVPSSPTPTITPDVPTATETSTPEFPPPPPASQTATPIIPVDWLTFTNSVYAFEFKYPPQGVIADGGSDTFARIDLPLYRERI